MKLFFSILFAMVFSINTNAQKTLMCKVLLKNSADTINLELIVKIYGFYPETLNELSFYHKIWYIKGNGKRDSYAETLVDYLEVVDFDGYKRAFVSNKYTGSLQLDGILVEKIAIGKINWYRQYYPHGYDGSVMSCDYFIKNNEEPVKIDWMSNRRKKLMQLTSDHPQFGEKISELDFKNPYEVIKWYNSN